MKKTPIFMNKPVYLDLLKIYELWYDKTKRKSGEKEKLC